MRVALGLVRAARVWRGGGFGGRVVWDPCGGPGHGVWSAWARGVAKGPVPPPEGRGGDTATLSGALGASLSALKVETRVLQEQVVITNPSGSDVDLSGCVLTDEFQRHTLVLPPGTVVKGGHGAVTVYTAPGNAKYLDPESLSRIQATPFEASRSVLWRNAGGEPRRKEVLNNGGDAILVRPDHATHAPQKSAGAVRRPPTPTPTPAPTPARAREPSPPRGRARADAKPERGGPPVLEGMLALEQLALCASTRPFALSVGRVGGGLAAAAPSPGSAVLISGPAALRHASKPRPRAINPVAWANPYAP